MRSRSWRLAGAIVVASLAGACAGGAPNAPSGPSAATSTSASPEARDWVHDIDIGGRTLSIACVGPTDTGRPTVIFENGLGGDRGVWADVLTALGETDRGCSYDRAGIGLSQPAPTPRTTDDQVTDLHDQALTPVGVLGEEAPEVGIGQVPAVGGKRRPLLRLVDG